MSREIQDLELAGHPLARFVTAARGRRIGEVLDARLTSVTAVFEDLCDPHNVAAVLRTAEALGVQDVHLVNRAGRVRPDRNIALGAERWLELHHHDRLVLCVGALQARGFEVWGADVTAGSLPLAEITGARPVALVFGSERVGLSRLARRYVDRRFHIPMLGFTGSYNVSVAAALALYQVTERRRQALGAAGDLDPVRRAELLDTWLKRSVRRSEQILRVLEPAPGKGKHLDRNR